MAENKTVKCFCNDCQKKTNHKILTDYEIPSCGDDDYWCETHYQVVQCLGCDNVELRTEFVDFENGHYVDDDGNDYEPDITDEIYPKRIPETFTSREKDCIPPNVMDLYNEVKKSIASDSRLLAGIGLRMLVESIANDLGISGGDLVSRITKMKDEHLITNAQCTMLHQIRFLGNDATHDITAPKIQSVNFALSVVESLIREKYIQPELANRTLPKVIRYEEFKKLIVDNACALPSGEERTILSFLPSSAATEKFENKREFVQKFLDEVKNRKVPEFSHVPTTPTPKLEQEKIRRN